ncbi:MAG TPA: MarR family transcriptional regulator [Pseudonocardiaceae bacterium]|nr:MarR family transcriptional regulator [Pseudonocardiaceae bacterium]
MHDANRTANLLGAAVLAIGDLVRAETASAAGTSASGAAALVVLADAPDLSGTELGRRIGLSQPAAARMVDGLAEAGLVRRQRGSGKSVAIRLTAAGRDAADRALAARHDTLAGSIAGLDPARQATLAELLGTVLDRVYDRIGSAELICRLCDRAACVARQASCPVGAAQRERSGSDQREWSEDG